MPVHAAPVRREQPREEQKNKYPGKTDKVVDFHYYCLLHGILWGQNSKSKARNSKKVQITKNQIN
jgi:hypothetical protein